ncbi:hypothetical protein PK98_10170 [Croceibacterium mercuriale]|uniref:DUF2254 domain-containing protein n=1 Tax=Croceibacterium mercuriale TaxID=1572751 RepID=A0A0B2BWP2_9SPHN|nr:DUF2254 domain-containing protein [Croceibacterium mercuriale]KHL24412.1 hypothetical protein PK98_10170 [Croceibacterium mercuriale]
MSEMRWLWSRLTGNYWFFPTLFAVGATALAFGMLALDQAGFAELLNGQDLIVPARPDSASTMLSLIASSMIGVAATVFSITIAAVAYASGSYGPRLLTNFMQDRGNQLSLATFIGTFVYALVVLRSVRAADEATTSAQNAAATALPGFVPQLSLLVAFGLMALSVGVLVYFLNHIPDSIRINTVLRGIGQALLDEIAELHPRLGGGEEGRDTRSGAPVRARRAGYIQFIDFDDLAQAARKHGSCLAMEVRTGDFIHAGMVLARVVDGPGDDAIADAVRHSLTIGSARTPAQDPQFLLDELVEIGLRALSPGINDPFTAITALHWVGAATADLAQRDLRKVVAEEAPEDRSVIPLADDFAHYLARGFGVMRSAVATSRPAALVMLDSLRNAAGAIDDEGRTGLLQREGDRLLEQARLELEGPDLQEVEARHALFALALR